MANLIDQLTTAELVHVVIESWNEMFLLVLIVIMRIGRIRDRSNDIIRNVNIPMTSELWYFYIAVLVYNFCDITDTLYFGTTEPHSDIIARCGVFIYYVAGGAQTLLFLQVIKKYIAEQNGDERLGRVIFSFQLMQIPGFLLLAVTPFTGALYRFDEGNNYIRSSGFWIWQGVTVLTFLFIGLVVIVNWKRTDAFLKRIVIIATFFPMIAFVGKLFPLFDDENNLMVMITSLLLFIMYERNKTEITVRMAHELESTHTQLIESRIALEKSKNETLMAQIQPHFIIDSLIALRGSCRDHPEIYESITYFTRYLRSHFEALGGDKLISFELELENIEAYLALEKQNYEDRLRVEYDIECNDFSVPALSVQPLVENAVRHGIGTYDKGGTVSVKVHEDESSRIVIEVTDDGSGKSSITPQQSKRKGIGIENVRARLKSYGSGELEINTTEQGTTARILLGRING